MVATLDQTADTSMRDLHRYSKLYSFPGYVKQASHSQTCAAPANLPSTVYADVRYRQFPCHTKAATWLSYLYFLEKRADMHEKIAGWVEERLNQFTSYWGLDGDIQQLRQKHASLHATDPLPDSDYMLVEATASGVKERLYPLTSPAAIQKAAEWFGQYRFHWPYEDRVVMANKLIEKAAKVGVGFNEDISEMLEKQAGRGWYNPPEVARHIRNRVKAAERVTPEFRERMEKLAHAVETAPGLSQNPDHCQMLCKTIDYFDRMTHLADKYSSAIPCPEDVVFPATWKVAQAFVNDGCTLTTGSVYNRDDFSKLALSEVRDLFGDSIAQEVANGLAVDPEKMADVAATFPRPDAQLFDRMLSDNGIAPVVKQATAVPRLSHQELRGLAQIRQVQQAATSY